MSTVAEPTTIPTAPHPSQPPAETPTFPEWHNELPDDLRGAKSLARYADIPALAKGFVELESKLGAPLKPPKADAPADEWARYRARIGAPESADKYVLERPQGLPDGMAWDEGTVKSFTTLAHSLGLTQEQVKALADFDVQRTLGVVDRSKTHVAETRKQAEAALTAAWGPQVYKRNLGLAKQGFEWALAQVKASDADKTAMRAFVEGPEFGSDPRNIRLWHAVAEALLEDGEITGEPLASATDVQARIDAIKNDPKHPANDPNHPGYSAAIDGLLELYRQLPGGREPVFTAVGRDR